MDLRRALSDRRRTIAIALGVLLFAIIAVLAQRWMARGEISPSELRELITADSSVILLDVRTAEEFEGELGRLPNAILIPVHELKQRVMELEPFKGHIIVAYCRSGRRSANAASFLSGQGFTVLNLEGGILEWSKLGFQVVKGHPK